LDIGRAGLSILQFAVCGANTIADGVTVIATLARFDHSVAAASSGFANAAYRVTYAGIALVAAGTYNGVFSFAGCTATSARGGSSIIAGFTD